jgi:hypothetical protein
MEPIDGSETSAISTQTPGKHPKENILPFIWFNIVTLSGLTGDTGFMI